MSKELVHHPEHYAKGRRYEPKDVIRDWELNFNLGSAVKYLSRAGRKDDILLDLQKAKQYIEFEIEAIEKDKEFLEAGTQIIQGLKNGFGLHDCCETKETLSSHNSRHPDRYMGACYFGIDTKKKTEV